MNSPEIQILLPVHNEAGSIEGTIREIYNEISPTLSLEFLVCEDGSIDGTKEILLKLKENYPIKLITSEERKGYSKAVKDGMLAMDAPFLLCLDSDGQCDPHDFWNFWKLRHDFDVLIGWRTKRTDTKLRKYLSRTFYYIYQIFFHVPAHDPSCPFILVSRSILQSLVNEMGVMQQGFWWEFTARVHLKHFRMKEIPIHHRDRTAGITKVYHLAKMPGIGIRHFIGLFQIRFHTMK